VTAKKLGAEVFSEVGGERGSVSEGLQGTQRYLLKKREAESERHLRMAKQSEADVCPGGPFGVAGDSFDDAGDEFGGRERAEDLSFGEEGVFEGDAGDAVVSFGEQSAGNTRGGAAREGELLSEGELREASDEKLVGHATKLGRDGWEKAGLDEVYQIELAKEAPGDQSRGARMEGEAATHGILGEPFFVVRDFIKEAGGEVFAFEKDFKMGEVGAGILEKGEEDVGGGVVEERGDGVSGGGAGEFCGGGHGQEKISR